MFSLGIAAEESLRGEEASLKQKQSRPRQRWSVWGDLLPRRGVGETDLGSFADYITGKPEG